MFYFSILASSSARYDCDFLILFFFVFVYCLVLEKKLYIFILTVSA
jgi:hypothetical protein